MGVPYYCYITCLCGIPSVEIKGNVDEWILLYEKICKLITLFTKADRGLSYMCEFLKNYSNIIENIIFHSFGVKTNNNVKIMHNNTYEFYKMMFNYENNPTCGSGHVPPIVYGWITQLYLKTWQIRGTVEKEERTWENNKMHTKKVVVHKEIDLSDLANDITYVPYKNVETGRMFFKAIGLVYSRNYCRNPNSLGMNNDEYLSPQYGSVIYEVMRKDIFDKISMNDPEGSKKFMF